MELFGNREISGYHMMGNPTIDEVQQHIHDTLGQETRSKSQAPSSTSEILPTANAFNQQQIDQAQLQQQRNIQEQQQLLQILPNDAQLNTPQGRVKHAAQQKRIKLEQQQQQAQQRASQLAAQQQQAQQELARIEQERQRLAQQELERRQLEAKTREIVAKQQSQKYQQIAAAERHRMRKQEEDKYPDNIEDCLEAFNEHCMNWKEVPEIKDDVQAALQRRLIFYICL